MEDVRHARETLLRDGYHSTTLLLDGEHGTIVYVYTGELITPAQFAHAGRRLAQEIGARVGRVRNLTLVSEVWITLAVDRARLGDDAPRTEGLLIAARAQAHGSTEFIRLYPLIRDIDGTITGFGPDGSAQPGIYPPVDAFLRAYHDALPHSAN